MGARCVLGADRELHSPSLRRICAPLRLASPFGATDPRARTPSGAPLCQSPHHRLKPKSTDYLSDFVRQRVGHGRSLFDACTRLRTSLNGNFQSSDTAYYILRYGTGFNLHTLVIDLPKLIRRSRRKCTPSIPSPPTFRRPAYGSSFTGPAWTIRAGACIPESSLVPCTDPVHRDNVVVSKASPAVAAHRQPIFSHRSAAGSSVRRPRIIRASHGASEESNGLILSGSWCT